MATDTPMISLADLANVDVSSVKEIRAEPLPQMVGVFQVKEAKIEALGDDSKPAIVIKNEVVAVESVLNNEKKPEDLMGKVHNETFFVKEAEDVGRFKAFCVDAGIGFEGPAPLNALLSQMVGMQYPGRITHRKDKNDPDRIYSNVRPIVKKAA
jgi:hypothetical protein